MDTLGRYKIVKEIGRGAMGVVYQGYDPKIDRIVALKTIRKDRLADSKHVEDLITRFQREVRSTGKLVHPNIIVIYDTGEEEETAYIAMEYIEGDTLENLIQKGIRFPMERVVDIIDQICDGLEFTHRQGVVHRDLKPSNIMLTKGERVKITDFGISKAVGSASSPLTQEGVLLGTPSYMSPEQIAGSKIDGRSDLFSLGIILYHLLTGENPFSGDTIPNLLYTIVHKEPAPPSQINPTVPALFDDVIAKALAKDPENRYATAKDFAEDVRRACRGESLKEAPTTDATAAMTTGVAEHVYPKRKNYRLLAGVGVLILALGLGGYYWIQRTSRRSKQQMEVNLKVQKILPEPVEEKPAEPTPPPRDEVRMAGMIVVRSEPPNARVFFNGEPLATVTPTVIEDVTVGEKHRIRIEKKGFEPWSDMIEPQADQALTIEASLTPLLGTLVVQSTPPGATVLLDGKRVSGLTPIELQNVSAGEMHSIELVKEGYETEVHMVALKPEDRKELTILLRQVLSGEIKISSDPAGAKVYLNDQYLDRETPTRVSGLSPGRYSLRLKKEGYKVWEDRVVVKASEPLELAGIKLQRAFGQLNIVVSPWADVYYMGKKLGTTPLANISLQEGIHKLILKNPPLKIAKQVTVRIVADQVTKRSIDITKGMKGKLKIKVIPWAHVYIDGKPMGMTPLKPIELRAGEHEVLVKNETLKAKQSFKVIIRANEVVSREVDLLELQ